MNKPNWKDAPEWAKWLARDKDGKWFWYETKPEPDSLIDGDMWCTLERGRHEIASEPDASWMGTLESRPCAE